MTIEIEPTDQETIQNPLPLTKGESFLIIEYNNDAHVALRVSEKRASEFLDILVKWNPAMKDTFFHLGSEVIRISQDIRIARIIRAGEDI